MGFLHFIDPLGPLSLIVSNEKLSFFPMGAVILVGMAAYGLRVSQKRAIFSIFEALNAILPWQFYCNPSGRRDFWNYIIYTIFMQKAVIWTFSLISSVLISEAISEKFGDFHIKLNEEFNIFVQLLFTIVFSDLGRFIEHYIFHKVSFLWSFHRVHHSAESFTIFSNFRIHPLEPLIKIPIIAGMTALGGGVAIYLTGGGLYAETVAILALFQLIQGVRILLAHYHVRISFGWFNYIVMSPIMHHVHHGLQERHWDKNFGDLFPIWDWILGTLYLPTYDEDIPIGIRIEETHDKNPHNTIYGFYIEPIAHAWEIIRRRICRDVF